MHPNKLFIGVAVLALIAAAQPAQAQYVDFTPREKAVDLNMDQLDQLPTPKKKYEMIQDCAPPLVPPVSQMPLQLTPAASPSEPPPLPAGVVEGNFSAPAIPPALADNEMHAFESALPTRAPGRVLKPLARMSDEPIQDMPMQALSVDAPQAVPPAMMNESYTPPQESYPSYMTQPGQISSPASVDRNAANARHMNAPATAPARAPEPVATPVPLVENTTPVQTESPRRIALPMQKPEIMPAEAFTPSENQPLPQRKPLVSMSDAETAAPQPEAQNELPPINVTDVVESEPTPVASEEPVAVEETVPPADDTVISDNAASATSLVPTISDLSIDFSGNESNLSAEAQEKLKNIVGQLNDMGDTRLQVRAYAAGEDGSKSSARRISLSRALAVRSFMMDNGIKPNRVDVRALGTETDRSPIDRVDLVFAR
jgi:outer membrane protein OmpA-like peptidoglycan-associated protein